MSAHPATALDPAFVLRGAALCAIQAPSTHNSQPWRFRRRSDGLEVWLDESRRLEVIDPTGRQALISCGCAIYNARVAIRAAGYCPAVSPFPDPDRPDLVALVRFGLPRKPTDDDRALLGAIARRHTNRRAYADRPISREHAALLARAAQIERARMLRLTPDQKARLADIVARGDARRFREVAYRAEVGRWLTGAGSRRKDGIPFAEKEYGSAWPFSVSRCMADPELGERAGALEHEHLRTAPLVAVLATTADEPLDWLDCGQALEAMLLRATQLGLSAAFHDQALVLADLRDEVIDLCGVELEPQMIVRVGEADPVEHPSPRRELDDVLEE